MKTVNGLTASNYVDATFALGGFTIANGSNTFTAVGWDSVGNASTNSVTMNLPGTNSYSYDLNGNLLSDGNRNFSYDGENELTNMWVTNAWRSDFVYDGKLRRRIERDYGWQGGVWLETNEIHFVYDGNLVIQERDANNNPHVTYTRGNDLSGALQGAGGIGGLLARTDNGQPAGGSSFAHAYYHADGNGNVTCLIYSNQMVAAKYLYDPFGNTLSMSGLLASANKYRFSSKEWNDNAGLYYYLYRFYDPNLQRWPNRDPMGELGGLNLYGFVLNNPVGYSDPFGLAQQKETDAESCFDNCKNTADQQGIAAASAETAGNIESGVAGGVFVAGGLFFASRGALVPAVITGGIGLGVGTIGVGTTMSHFQAQKGKIKNDYVKCLNTCKKKYPGQDTCDAAAQYYKDHPIK